MSDRDRVLGRIRAASVDVTTAECSAWNPDTNEDPAAAYIRRRELDVAAMRNEFIERCRDYRANVRLCRAGDQAVSETVSAICVERGAETLAAPRDLPAGWVPARVTARGDEPELSVAELDTCDGVLTGCAVAIASTGTIVFDAGATQGRRVLTLIPDLHICVVRTEQIRAGVPEAIAALRQAAADGAPLTFISGPSATSDIELQRVEGVHGPRQLEVIVAGVER